MRSRCHPRPRSVLLVAAAALWLSLVGCSSGGGIVDHTKLEEGIAKQAAAGNLTVTAVVCPEGRPLIEGEVVLNMEGGLPKFVELEKVPVDKILPARA